ncbi:MAG: carbohydrate-binding protein [Prevotellaceae bacterium]|nr:carbohydrate-binding protein [Prevotellaceae bacterium]
MSNILCCNTRETVVSVLKQIVLLTILIIVITGCRRNNDDPQPPVKETSRSVIRNNTVYTASSTPLRGSFIGIDYDFPHDRMITSNNIAALKQNGLNALHVYVENNYTGRPAGYQVERCDFIVDETEKQGLYTIITIGVINYPGDFENDVKFVMDFWEFYAKRYKDREHVIFEICNEMPYLEGITPKVQADAFRLIRKHSPDAMVLFYSLPGTNEIEYILNTAVPELEREIGSDLDWTNEAVAFHGYEGTETSIGADHFHRVIRDFKAAGYPLINTEVPNRYGHTVYTDVALLKICEEEGISWVCFTEYIRVPQRAIWRGRLEAAQIAWKPDFGDWPVIDAVFPFVEHNADKYVGKASAKPVTDGGTVAYSFSDKDYITYTNLNFGERNPLLFSTEVKSENGGIIAIRKGNENGQIIGQCLVPGGNGNEYITCNGYITAYTNGATDIVLAYEANAGNAEPLFLRNWKFELPLPESYIDPYKIIYAYNFPYATGNIKRAVSTDNSSTSPMLVEGITDGAELHFDFLLFDNKEITFNIRAMPVEGGIIEIYCGDFAGIESELGICEINGVKGEWNTYTCSLKLNEILMINGNPSYWDLKLIFKGNGSGELFKISEFYFGETKPEPNEGKRLFN